jgi:hypothetical protein
MLWLYDSRDRMHGKRKLHILPLTSEGKQRAWDIVLDAEVPNERDDYAGLADADATEDEPGNVDLFNDYWCEYGWCLMGVDPYAKIPNDAEVVTLKSEVD